MILIDTSAWIEYDRAMESQTDHRLMGLIGDGEPVSTTEPVLMEVLAGARSGPDAVRLRRLLLSNDWLPIRASDYESAAAINRECRFAGFEPGGTVDCLIAAIALRNDAAVLAADTGFENIARVVPLRLDQS